MQCDTRRWMKFNIFFRFKITLDEKHKVIPLPEVVMRATDGIKVYLEQR